MPSAAKAEAGPLPGPRGTGPGVLGLSQGGSAPARFLSQGLRDNHYSREEK